MYKVFVGLSGGVDSAVSAALLQREGHDVTGVFIKIQIPGYPCPTAADRIEAMRVAAHLRIPFIEIDLSKEYEEEVFRVSLREFEKGRTPNPDTICNREIKFGKFYDFAMQKGADVVATGHYARIAPAAELLQRSSAAPRPFVKVLQPIAVELHVSADEQKDQSYFLWAVPETHLRHTLFPVGNMRKTQVRILAGRFHLPNAARHDSQGLCFLGNINIEDMLQREIPQKPGSVLDEEGKIIGEHKGAALYTLGQRHGFELFAHKGAESADTLAHFVIAKDIEKNTITVSTDRTPPRFKKTVLELSQTNWIGSVSSGTCEARFRYRQKLIPATLNIEKNSVTLEEPHFVPEGQSLVLYIQDRCLGGGIIESATLL